MIAIEEREALPDGTIPEHARIWGMDVQLSEDSGSTITHKRCLSSEDHAGSVETIQENLSW